MPFPRAILNRNPGSRHYIFWLFLLDSSRRMFCLTDVPGGTFPFTPLRNSRLWADLGSSVWSFTDTSTPQMVTHPSTNHARRRLTPSMDLALDEQPQAATYVCLCVCVLCGCVSLFVVSVITRHTLGQFLLGRGDYSSVLKARGTHNSVSLRESSMYPPRCAIRKRNYPPKRHVDFQSYMPNQHLTCQIGLWQRIKI